MDLLVIDVVGDQRPEVLALGAAVGRGQGKLAVGGVEQHVDRRHRLFEQFSYGAAHGRCHRCLLWAECGRGWLRMWSKTLPVMAADGPSSPGPSPRQRIRSTVFEDGLDQQLAEAKVPRVPELLDPER